MKQIKDPIYGYVNIDDEYTDLIDTPEFQRLRNIIQTSYQALYPSALHNRFTHSIGVFHLGKKAFDAFRRNVEKDYPHFYQGDWDVLRTTFLSACLLHDVGHSPFSHTGERFYVNNFRDEIKNLIPNSIELYEDMKHGTGKPHEAMSAIVGLKLLKARCTDKIDEELFVRAIIGVKFEKKAINYKLIENTVIGMLNGTLIDVDKLDYLIRDGYVTGFNTMSLDVERLFEAYTIAEYEDASASARMVPAYKRGALSVIENVTFANDLERHWIQNHPSILYDAKLVDLTIASYNKFMTDKYRDKLTAGTVFTEKALSLNGYIKDGIPLSLLSDDDIIAYLKNCEDRSDDAVWLRKQYFERNSRLKPLWKSEAEFSHLEREILGAGIRRSFKSALKAISGRNFFINKEEMNNVLYQKDLMEKVISENINEDMVESAKTSLRAQETVVKIFEIFENFSTNMELKFEFAFIFVEHHYESNYSKLQNSDIYVEFTEKRVIPFEKALSVAAIQPDEDEKNGYYYIYTSKSNIKRMEGKGLDCGREIFGYISQNWNRIDKI